MMSIKTLKSVVNGTEMMVASGNADPTDLAKMMALYYIGLVLHENGAIDYADGFTKAWLTVTETDAEAIIRDSIDRITKLVARLPLVSGPEAREVVAESVKLFLEW